MNIGRVAASGGTNIGKTTNYFANPEEDDDQEDEDEYEHYGLRSMLKMATARMKQMLEGNRRDAEQDPVIKTEPPTDMQVSQTERMTWIMRQMRQEEPKHSMDGDISEESPLNGLRSVRVMSRAMAARESRYCDPIRDVDNYHGTWEHQLDARGKPENAHTETVQAMRRFQHLRN